MEIVFFMIGLGVVTFLVTAIIGVTKKYSIGESVLWGLLAFIMSASFGGMRGALPMLVVSIICIVIATRITPYNQLPKQEK